MPVGEHQFNVTVEWTGNLGKGTASYRAYDRNHEIIADEKFAPILGSSAVEFRGDESRYNPEELLVAALSSCHMLWFLHLCAEEGVVVTSYKDHPIGWMHTEEDGSGRFFRVLLQPEVSILTADRSDDCEKLHDRAHQMCFIARSMNFPVEHKPTTFIEMGSRHKTA